VSESNERHCAGAVQSHGVGIRYVKQMCLETGPETATEDNTTHVDLQDRA